MPAGALRLVVLSLFVSVALAPLNALRAPAGGSAPAPSPTPQSAPQPEPKDADAEAAPEDEGADDAASAQDAQAAAEDEADLEDEDWPVPAGLHLSTYASRLCARLDRNGALDSGAGVLQLVDADSGQPLAIRDLGFGRGPTLWAEGQLDLPGVEAKLRML